jgi:hypothetical protein
LFVPPDETFASEIIATPLDPVNAIVFARLIPELFEDDRKKPPATHISFLASNVVAAADPELRFCIANAGIPLELIF